MRSARRGQTRPFTFVPTGVNPATAIQATAAGEGHTMSVRVRSANGEDDVEVVMQEAQGPA